MFSEKMKEKVLSAIESHPLNVVANSWGYCVSDVFMWPKEKLGKAKISDVEKLELESSLAGIGDVLIVVYHTSEKTPEPLAGYGKSYHFVIHPISYKVLLTEVGTWRS